MKYLVIIEKTATGFSAYSPDVEGCIATATTIAELKQNMQAAMGFHLVRRIKTSRLSYP